ncbi:hypothetical protein [Pedobacter heparinus]|uniref:hypothetical protein n=1 Tax=Pedobacter heparinus TaxID=984 RepID=UPI00292FD7C1|nr:hypothetical protein [Pedobacter heparinus]
MKKYISGIIAVVIAVVCFGFISPKKRHINNSDVVLTFRGNITNRLEVEDGSYWIEEPSFGNPEYEGCWGPGATCAIRVPEQLVTGYYGYRYLDGTQVGLAVGDSVWGGGGIYGWHVVEASGYFIIDSWTSNGL